MGHACLRFSTIIPNAEMSDIVDRLVVAAGIAKLPGHIVPINREDHVRMASYPNEISPHSPMVAIRRHCTSTGATMTEMMVVQTDDQKRGGMVYDLHGVPGTRPFRIEIVLDVDHRRSDAMPGDDDPTAWPERSNAQARLAMALDGTTTLLDHIRRGLEHPGDQAECEGTDILERFAAMRLAIAHAHAPGHLPFIREQNVVARFASPWTKPHVDAIQYLRSSKETEVDILDPTGIALLTGLLPVAADVRQHVVGGNFADRTDHYVFDAMIIPVGMPDEDEIDALDVMRDIHHFGLTHERFLFPSPVAKDA